MSARLPRPAAEVDVSEDLVRSLVASARPDLTTATLVEVGSGWDNSVWRLGGDLAVRVPRRLAAVPLLVNEQEWLPRLAPVLPLPVPVPVVAGEPTEGYPWPWSICRWVPGTSWYEAPPADEVLAAVELGRFLRALHRPAPPDAPRSSFRGGSLRSRDETVRARAGIVSEVVGVDAVLEMWTRVLSVDGVDDVGATWAHADLHPLNVACSDGRVSGVLDFGDLTAADPGVDLSLAWTMLDDPGARRALFDAYGADVPTIARGAGWALNHGLACVAGSSDHPAVDRIGRTTLARLVEDPPA